MITASSPQEFIRPSQAHLFGVSKGTIYNWMKDGTIKNVVVRRPGNTRGARLISVESLRQYLAGCPEK
jgi:predicted site-specific integrase-resolvase